MGLGFRVIHLVYVFHTSTDTVPLKHHVRWQRQLDYRQTYIKYQDLFDTAELFALLAQVISDVIQYSGVLLQCMCADTTTVDTST